MERVCVCVCSRGCGIKGSEKGVMERRNWDIDRREQRGGAGIRIHTYTKRVQERESIIGL